MDSDDIMRGLVEIRQHALAIVKLSNKRKEDIRDNELLKIADNAGAIIDHVRLVEDEVL